jgi:protein SCO1/2
MSRLWSFLRFSALALVVFMHGQGLAYDPRKPLVTGQEIPKDLQGVGVEEHRGDQITLGLPFVDENGNKVTLGKYFDGTKPVLMAMVYYTCPNICNYHLNALKDTMKQLKWTAGDQFQVVAVSMNEREGPKEAAAKKAVYVESYGRPGSIDGWHFLTGTKENIKKLADQLGFEFHWVEDQQQFAHTSVAYVLTPGGKISRYLYGLAVASGTLKVSLLEASNGKIGNVVEQVILYCLHFDPGKNRYTLYAWNVMRLGGVLILMIMALILVPIWWAERKRSSRPEA